MTGGRPSDSLAPRGRMSKERGIMDAILLLRLSLLQDDGSPELFPDLTAKAAGQP
jgi:hypothetical protein